MNNFFRNKKILITGHTGFQGAWLTKILLHQGANIVGISLKEKTNPNLFDIFNLNKKVKTYYGDIRDIKLLGDVLEKEKPEIVFHLAAQAIVLDSYDDPIFTHTTNIIGTANLLESIRFCNSIKSVVIVTTDKVYENDETGKPYNEDHKLGGYDPYSSSKAAADIVTSSYIRSFFNPLNFGVKHNTLIGIARSGNVIGGGDWANFRLLPDAVRSTYNNKKLVIRNPDAVRPWQHVFEPLSGYLKLAESLYIGEVNHVGAWNFGPSEKSCIGVESVIKDFFKILGAGNYKIESNQDKHEANLLMLDNNKAKKFLGWRPKLNLNTCLDWTAIWYKTYYEKPNIIESISNEQINVFFENDAMNK